MTTTALHAASRRALILLLLAGAASWALAGNPLAVADAASDRVENVFVTNEVPVRVAEQGQHFQKFDAMTVPGGQTNFSKVLVTVPAGKKFVLERVNGEANTVQDGTVKAQIGGGGATLTMPLTPALANPSDLLKRGHFNEEVDVEVPGPGELVGVINRFGPKPDVDVAQGWVIVGRMVDCPTCQPAP